MQDQLARTADAGSGPSGRVPRAACPDFEFNAKRTASPSRCPRVAKRATLAGPAILGARVVIECLVGSARLTAACESAGLEAFGIDHKGNRHKPEGRVVTLDLSAPSDQQPIKDMLHLGSNVVFIWFGFPCGTMSRARGIPLASGKPGPQPLRSEQLPRRLPNLSPADAAKVASANTLVDFARACITLCDDAGIKWGIENLQRSLLWWFPELIELIAVDRMPKTIDVTYVRRVHVWRRATQAPAHPHHVPGTRRPGLAALRRVQRRPSPQTVGCARLRLFQHGRRGRIPAQVLPRHRAAARQAHARTTVFTIGKSNSRCHRSRQTARSHAC